MKFFGLIAFLLTTSSAMAASNLDLAKKIHSSQRLYEGFRAMDGISLNSLLACGSSRSGNSSFRANVHSLLKSRGEKDYAKQAKQIEKFVYSSKSVIAIETETGFEFPMSRCRTVQELALYLDGILSRKPAENPREKTVSSGDYDWENGE